MTSTLHHSGSRSTRQTNELKQAPFSPAPTPANTLSSAAMPPGLSNLPSRFAAPELPKDMPLAIPELWSFDQDELNDNPVLNEVCPIPLIGALLLARQLITREQLDAGLHLQAQTYPALPIGQILVQSGYISQAALDRTLGIQANMRSSLDDTDHA
jgi:hypothetical protein